MFALSALEKALPADTCVPGTSPGDHTYVRLPGGEGCAPTGYGGGGVVLLTAPWAAETR